MAMKASNSRTGWLRLAEWDKISSGERADFVGLVAACCGLVRSCPLQTMNRQTHTKISDPREIPIPTFSPNLRRQRVTTLPDHQDDDCSSPQRSWTRQTPSDILVGCIAPCLALYVTIRLEGLLRRDLIESRARRAFRKSGPSTGLSLTCHSLPDHG